MNRAQKRLKENLKQQEPFMKAIDNRTTSILHTSNKFMLLDHNVEPYEEEVQSLEGVSLVFAQQVLSHLHHLMLSTPKISHIDSSSTPKVIIKHPVTKEIIHLSPKTSSKVSTAPLSPVGLSKNAKNKLYKKKLALQHTTISTDALAESSKPEAKVGNVSISSDFPSPLPSCATSLQDWDGLDRNGFKDSAFWANYHAAQADLSQIARPEEYPFMFVVDSDEDRLSGSSDSLEKHMSLFSSSSSNTSQKLFDFMPKKYHKAADSIDQEEFVRPLSSSKELTPPPQDIQVTPYARSNQLSSTTLSVDELAGVPAETKVSHASSEPVKKGIQEA